MRVEKPDGPDTALITNGKRKLMQGNKDDWRGCGFRKQVSPIFA